MPPLQLKSLLRAARAAAKTGLAALLLLSPGPVFAAARLTLSSGGVSRTAVIVEHERLKLRRRPLIIVLQRSGGVAGRAHRRIGLEETALSAKPVFVYPEALGGQWPVAPGPDAERDLKYLHLLADHLIDQGVVDPRRIFLVGVGSGGAFAYRAACAGVGRPVAGMATFIAAMPRDIAACAPAAPLAFISVSNAQDPHVPYAGGKALSGELTYDAMAAEQSFAAFAKINGCGARREDKSFPERKEAKGARGVVLSYAGCKAPTELIRIDAASHRLPGRPPENGDESAGDFDASRAVWDFFKKNGA
jgi:polyhydroxybutyrate depolymerase